jgi:hypothetical protein
MRLRDYFAEQIATNKIITPDAEAKITYRRVWSGKLIKTGEKVLYAYAQDADGNRRLFSLLESELDELSPYFEFIEMMDETVPVFKQHK